MSLQKANKEEKGVRGMDSYVLSSTNNNHAGKRRRDGDLLENETNAQGVLLEERPVGKARLYYSCLMTSNSSNEHEIDFKTDSFN